MTIVERRVGLSMQGRTTTPSLGLSACLAVPGLIGLTLGLYAPATIARFETLFRPLCSLADPALLAILVALAFGMWLPNRFARAFSKFASRVHHRLSGARTESEWEDLSDPAGIDAHLRLIGAGSLVLGGLSMMLLNTFGPGFGHVYGAALETFHWTRLTLGLLVTLLIGAYVLLPVVLVGTAFNCVQRVALLHTPRRLIAFTNVCIGGSVGLVIWIVTAGLSPATVTQVCALILLFTGVLHMQPSDSARLQALASSAVPRTADRWGFVLPWMLRATGFLIVYHLMLWLQIRVVEQPRLLTVSYFCSVSVGLVTANFALSRMLWPLHRLAILCMLIALSLAALIVRANPQHVSSAYGIDVTGQAAWFWSAAIVVPALLSGVLLGAAVSATVERSCRAGGAMLSSTLSICTGAGLACAAAILNLTELWPHYHQLVLLVLLWLAMGGLLLIHEPHFSLKSRRPHVAFMFASLLLVTVILPRAAEAWVAENRVFDRASLGSCRVINSSVEADRYLIAAVAGQTTRGTHKSRGRFPAPFDSADSIIERLVLSNQHPCVVALHLPAHRWSSLRSMQQRGLVAAAVGALHPDGTFVMRLTDVPPQWDGGELARRRVEDVLHQTQFSVDQTVSGETSRREWVLLASKRSAGELAGGQPDNLSARVRFPRLETNYLDRVGGSRDDD